MSKIKKNANGEKNCTYVFVSPSQEEMQEVLRRAIFEKIIKRSTKHGVISSV